MDDVNNGMKSICLGSDFDLIQKVSIASHVIV